MSSEVTINPKSQFVENVRKWALIDSQGNTYSDFIYEKIVWFESDLFLCHKRLLF